MPTPAPHRLLLAVLSLTLATLACARSDVAIDPAGQTIATLQVIPASPTTPPLVLASATSELAEATDTGAATATTVPSPTRPATATPQFVFNIVPITNGAFDADLSGWSGTPNWTVWRDGYARVNAGQAGGGALLLQITEVPQAREVKLHFIVRSEDTHAGECVVESRQASAHPFPADQEWHAIEIDFTLEAGTETAVSLKAKNNGLCDWLNFDDVYWLVASDTVAVPSDTPAGLAPAGATATAEATEQAATATLAAIPPGASFTQDFTVSAEGDTPVGAPSDLRDGQTNTWASLRNGQGAWVFNLGSARSVAGLRLVAQRDGNQDTTVLSIDVSTDGATWTVVYSASGDCAGTPNCQVIAQQTPVDFAFGPISAQYVRVRGGPTRFALAEVEIAVIGN